MRCKTCCYSLTNLSAHRCPECGAEFDPNDPSSFEHAGTRRLRPLRLLWPIAIVFLGMFVPTFFSFQPMYDDLGFSLVGGLAMSVVYAVVPTLVVCLLCGIIYLLLRWTSTPRW
jgi:hypothetical protein